MTSTKPTPTQPSADNIAEDADEGINEGIAEDTDDYLVERPNKSALKRQAQAEQAGVLELALLPKKLRSQLNIHPDAMTALDKIAGMKADHARKREVRFISTQFDDFELDNMTILLQDIKQATTQALSIEHTVEQWRDRLLADPSKLTEFINEYPHADVQPLRQLLRQAAKEQQHNKPPAAARKLFKLLRTVIAN